MKAVFPCKGVVVLSKKDIQNLASFYQSTLVTSKMVEIFNTTEYMVQVGNFNYLPPKSKVIVDENNSLTITKLRSMMNNTQDSNPVPKIKTTKKSVTDTISDEDILSHPFFTTLKPLN